MRMIYCGLGWFEIYKTVYSNLKDIVKNDVNTNVDQKVCMLFVDTFGYNDSFGDIIRIKIKECLYGNG